MKKTAALIEKLIRLAGGDTLPASSLKGDWFEQMQADDILVAVTHGSRKSLRVVNTSSFRNYLANTTFVIWNKRSNCFLTVVLTGHHRWKLQVTASSYPTARLQDS